MPRLARDRFRASIRARAAAAQRVLTFSDRLVITSYSIHYTKLYDFFRTGCVFLALSILGVQPASASIEAIQSLIEKGSYNFV